MNKNSKAKAPASASSKKVKQFKISPLIFVIAIVEVIVLIGAVSYAWFVIARNNQVNSGMITVAPDAGLRIDFNDASKSNYINVWNYLKDFNFEPGTSVDGRNIFFPTTGTFNKTVTKDIKFREGTVNDVNSKYIAVDFTLTNTNDNAAQVYLDNSSYFTVRKSNDNSTTGKALRIAFYQNDNKSGKVASSALKKLSQDQSNITTVYFNNSLGWSTPKIYIFRENGNNDDPYGVAWPGAEMGHVAGDLYYFSFINSKNNTANYYDSVVFDDGTSSGYQTVDLTLTNNYLYTPTTVSSGKKYNASTVNYSDYVSDSSSSGYAVIAPGVSAGFQRPYAPVTTINDDTGAPVTVVPAYADSIDQYYTLDNASLFTIPKDTTQSLTMIIWLEGTDDNCTESTYAGDKIDLNLVFNTSNERLNNYTYKFIDATKENWLADTITNKQTGLTFKPVIQLYDKTDQRGYLMNLTGKTWYVSATQDIVTKEHDIEFRRVNPNDEDEVWNFWDASEVKPKDIFSLISEDGSYTYSNGTVAQQKSVYFTAFADGAPARGSSNNANLPVHSCGGLWGNHSTTKELIYIDNTTGKSIVKNNGALTLNYVYHYDASHSQTVEYKASPNYSDQFYYFIVPTEIVKYVDNHTSNSGFVDASDGSSPVYKFKKYNNFDSDYALNVPDRNPNVTYNTCYTASGSMDGIYAMTGGTDSTTSSSTYTYFGRDIQYFMIKCKDPDFTHNAAFRVHYYNNDNSYQDINLRVTSGNFYWTDWVGYPCVVPNSPCNNFVVYRMSTNYNTIYNQTYNLNWDHDKNTCKVQSYDSNDNSKMYAEFMNNGSWP